MVSLIVLLIVFVLIAVRRIGNLRLQIWQVMVFGALAVLFTGQIAPGDALKAINPDVMLFLFGMFIIGRALEESGYLANLSCRFFHRARTLNGLVLFILFGMGILSALLMNDTLAIIGTPLVLMLARKNGVQSKVLLLALAFAITTGSVMSPIGNPQNLLIAVGGGIVNPFVTFLSFLLVPTLLNLFLAYILLRVFYRGSFNGGADLNRTPEPVRDAHLAGLTRVSLVVLVVLIVARIVFAFTGWGAYFDFRLTYIAGAAMLPVMLFSRKRWALVRGIDWSTLVFFAAMFVLMASVWQAGFFQSLLARLELDMSSVSIIMLVSILLSQLISNVPLVALYLPVLKGAGTSSTQLMALAAGSTIAGNLSILGAASNVIIIQNAEARGSTGLSFLEFLRIGLPLTAVNTVVYWLFFTVVKPV